MSTQMTLEPRSAWNARAADTSRMTAVGMDHWTGIRIHHSGTSASTTLRSIQDYQMDARGWPDIGYTMAVRGGRAFIARGLGWRPAHDSINTTIGVLIPGDYRTTLPAAADLDALVWLCRQLPKLVGRDLGLPDGHRDAVPNVTGTVCPGDAFHAWIHNELPKRLKEDDVTREELVAAVREALAFEVTEGDFADRRGWWEPGTKHYPQWALRNAWGYGKDVDARSAQLLAEVAAVRAELAVLGDKLDAPVREAGDAACQAVLDRLAEAHRAAAEVLGAEDGQ